MLLILQSCDQETITESIFQLDFVINLFMFERRSFDHILQTPFQGWLMAITSSHYVMLYERSAIIALLSGFVGVSIEAIIKKDPSMNGVLSRLLIYYDSHDPKSCPQVLNNWTLRVISIISRSYLRLTLWKSSLFSQLSLVEKYGESIYFSGGIVVSIVLKYADNIVKVLQESIGAVKPYLRQFIDV
uniref:Uncharacterized protein n=1 Tax=Cucumis melo TaxID=3656 RepID=A0A9I9EIU2_CUCME